MVYWQNHVYKNIYIFFINSVFRHMCMYAYKYIVMENVSKNLWLLFCCTETVSPVTSKPC